MSQLPDCPFCGKNELSVEMLDSAWGIGEPEEHVVCDNCAASAPVDVWKMREEENQ